MSAAYEFERWHDLMVATVGTMAALTGVLLIEIKR
jgi:hypothetical protein